MLAFHVLLDSGHEFQQAVFAACINIKVFGSVNCEGSLYVLLHHRILASFVGQLTVQYSGTKSAVNYGRGMASIFHVDVGVRQRCALAPSLLLLLLFITPRL